MDRFTFIQQLCKNFIITFKEKQPDLYESAGDVLQQWRNGKIRTRRALNRIR